MLSLAGRQRIGPRRLQPAQPVAAIARRMQQGFVRQIRQPGCRRQKRRRADRREDFVEQQVRGQLLPGGRPNTTAASNCSVLKSRPCDTEAVSSICMSGRSFCRRITRGSTQRIAQVGHLTRSAPAGRRPASAPRPAAPAPAAPAPAAARPAASAPNRAAGG